MKIRINPLFNSKEVEGQMILLNLKSGEIFELNETASCVWVCIKNRKKIDYIIRKLVTKYNIDSITAKKDIDDFLYLAKKNKFVIDD